MPVKQTKTAASATNAAPQDVTETEESTTVSTSPEDQDADTEGAGDSDADAAAQERTWKPVEWNDDMDLLLARTTLQLHKGMISGSYTPTTVAKILKADLLFKDYPTLDATKINTRLKRITKDAKEKGLSLEFPPFDLQVRTKPNAAAIVNGLQDLLG